MDDNKKRWYLKVEGRAAGLAPERLNSGKEFGLGRLNQPAGGYIVFKNLIFDEMAAVN